MNVILGPLLIARFGDMQFSAQTSLTTSLDFSDATGSNVLGVILFGNGSQNVVEYH